MILNALKEDIINVINSSTVQKKTKDKLINELATVFEKHEPVFESMAAKPKQVVNYRVDPNAFRVKKPNPKNYTVMTEQQSSKYDEKMGRGINNKKNKIDNTI